MLQQKSYSRFFRGKGWLDNYKSIGVEIINMNKLLLYKITLICLLLYMASCSSQPNSNQYLTKAESCWRTDPETAKALLDSIPYPENLNASDNARWCMITAQLSDSIQIDFPYSHQLKRAIRYFIRKNKKDEEIRATFYLGRAYANDRDFDASLTTYLRALDMAIEIKDWNLAGYISSYMGDVYNQLLAFPLSKEKYLQAASYFRETGNRRSQGFAFLDAGRLAAYSDSLDLALQYMLTADSLIKTVGDSSDISSILNGLGNIYGMKQEYALAEYYLNQSILFYPQELAPNNLALATYYLEQGKLEEAAKCLDKASEPTANKETHIDLLHHRSLLEKKKRNFKQALEYMEQYVDAQDSLQIARNDAELISLEKKYDHSQLSLDNMRLRNHRLFMFIICGSLLIGLLVAIIIYQYRLHIKNKNIHRQQKKIKEQAFSFSLLVKEYTLKQQELNNLQDLLDKYQSRETIEINYENLKNKYDELKQEEEKLSLKIQSELTRIFQESDIMKKLINKSEKVIPGNNKPLITPSLWKAIYELVDAVYPSVKVKIAEAELDGKLAQYCYLSVFSFDTNREAILLGIQQDSVSKRRSRVRKALGFEEKGLSLSEYFRSKDK